MLLALVALAAAGLESVSFGHQHLAGGHALHHHHFYSASHEHPDAHHGHDRDQEEDPRAPAPHHRNAPHRTTTVSAAPALAQPVGLTLLAAPLEKLALAVPVLALPQVARTLARLLPPRAPPTPLPPFLAS